MTLMLSSAACASSNASGSKVYTVATSNSSVHTLARIQGVLAGQSNADGTACFWLPEAGGERMALIWPHGYSARGNPLSVVDDNGHNLATVGRMVALGGNKDLAPQRVIGCSASQTVWYVGAVELLP